VHEGRRNVRFCDPQPARQRWVTGAFGPELCALIEPFYPKPGNARPPVGVERIYLLQHWFNLSDPTVEYALYDRRRWRVANALTEGGAMLCSKRVGPSESAV
jgi:Transposase domain (DUF772)